jgi:leucyl-tRNA synthetase
LTLSRGLTVKEIEEAVMADENTSKYLAGGSVKKVIIVPNKIINIVC